MTKKSRVLFSSVITVVLLTSTMLAHALPASSVQNDATSPQLKALLAKARAAEDKKDFAAATAEYRQAIELNPNSTAAHSGYMSAVRAFFMAKERAKGSEQGRGTYLRANEAATRELSIVYDAWTKQYPNKAVVQWAAGSVHSDDSKEAEKYFLKAIALDPNFGDAYSSLGKIAELRGDREKTLEYFKKASELKPDPRSEYRYLVALSSGNPATFNKMVDEFIARYPQSELGAALLSRVADGTKDATAKIAVLERLRALKFPGGYGERPLYSAYLANDPAKAVAMAQEKVKAATRDRETERWKPLLILAQNVAQAKALMADNRPAEAGALLEKTTAPDLLNDVNLRLLKARAFDASGKTESSYKTLLELVAREGYGNLKPVVQQYAAKLNKTPQQVNDDIWQIRFQNAKPMPDFELSTFTGGKVRLSSLRGKTVLLNFFFPG